jgi:hypothetical protein
VNLTLIPLPDDDVAYADSTDPEDSDPAQSTPTRQPSHSPFAHGGVVISDCPVCENGLKWTYKNEVVCDSCWTTFPDRTDGDDERAAHRQRRAREKRQERADGDPSTYESGIPRLPGGYERAYSAYHTGDKEYAIDAYEDGIWTPHRRDPR